MAQVKICGLTTPEAVDAAVRAGARYLGFNFFAKSPRLATPALAASLAIDVPPGVAKVGLVVNASDAELDALLARVPLDLLQLHGRESPERVAEIRARTGLPILKAVGIATRKDVAEITGYETVADMILVDARPAPGAVLPGGNGLTFDWRLIAGRKWQKPWMLAGGLTPENVARAINLTGATMVDTASGVESAPGIKDSALIRAFLAAAHSA